LKKSFTRLIAFILFVVISLSTLPVFAVPYVKDDEDTDGNSYYIVEGKAVKELFDFSLQEVIRDPVGALAWVFSFKTFTVLKKYRDDDGTWKIKGYWNTPNLQMLAKNLVTASIADGYTDECYDVNDTTGKVPVGDSADKVNAITRYGFKLPNYTYWGEYPKLYMSVQNIVPTGWFEGFVRAIASFLFGCSFIQPPDARNYQTITYWNHEYGDKSEQLVWFIQHYYLPYCYKYIQTYKNDDSWNNGYHYKHGANEDESGFNGADHHDHFIESISETAEFDGVEKPLKIRNSGTEYASRHGDKGATDFLNLYTTKPEVEQAQKVFQSQRLNITVGQLRRLIFYMRNGRDITDNYVADSMFLVGGYKETVANIETFSDTDVREYKNYSAMAIGKELQWLLSTYNHQWYSLNEMCSVVEWRNALTNAVRAWLADTNADHTGFDMENIDVTTYNPYFSGRIEDTSLEQSALNLTQSEDGFYRFSDIILTHLYNFNTKEPVAQYGAPPFEKIMDIPDDDEELSAIFSEVDKITALYDAWQEKKDKLRKFENKMNSGKSASDASVTNKVWSGIKTFFAGSEHDDAKKRYGIDEWYIQYNQCMIKNMGEDNECWSTAYSDEKATICFGDLWALGGLYKAIDLSQYNINDTISREDAIKIINCIREFSGAYYPEVMEIFCSMIYKMFRFWNDDNELETQTILDERVMPYDVESMTPDDQANYDIVDPRVAIYRSHFVGGVVSNILPAHVGFNMYFKLQPKIIDLAGSLTEWSVLFQQLINFDVFEDNGLSPSSLWDNAFVTILMLFLAMVFIWKTVAAIYSYITKGGKALLKIISMFLVLAFEVGLFTLMMINPDGMWNKVKTPINWVMNFGETVMLDDGNLTYLFGDGDDRDPAVAYYIPYLDIWSAYNTGHGLMADSQLVATAEAQNLPETIGIRDDDNYPKIGQADIKHWSIILLDSFEYHGHSGSLLSLMDENGHLINGKRINNNAYRVLDHFLAPRISLNQSGDKINLSVEANENYNGKFQSGTLDMITKLLNVILVLFLSLVKLLTFIWFWFQLYIFMFRVVLAKAAEHKGWKQILAEVFTPLLAMVVIGLWAGFCIKLNGTIEGFVGLIAEITLYALTIFFFRMWNKTRQYFPFTLQPIAMVLCHESNKRRKAREQLARDRERSDIENEYDEYFDREKMFNEDGSVNAAYASAGKYQDEYEQHFRAINQRIKSGEHMTDLELRQIESYNDYMRKQGTNIRYNRETGAQEFITDNGTKISAEEHERRIKEQQEGSNNSAVDETNNTSTDTNGEGE